MLSRAGEQAASSWNIVLRMHDAVGRLLLTRIRPGDISVECDLFHFLICDLVTDARDDRPV